MCIGRISGKDGRLNILINFGLFLNLTKTNYISIYIYICTYLYTHLYLSNNRSGRGDNNSILEARKQVDGELLSGPEKVELEAGVEKEKHCQFICSVLKRLQAWQQQGNCGQNGRRVWTVFKKHWHTPSFLLLQAAGWHHLFYLSRSQKVYPVVRAKLEGLWIRRYTSNTGGGILYMDRRIK